MGFSFAQLIEHLLYARHCVYHTLFMSSSWQSYELETISLLILQRRKLWLKEVKYLHMMMAEPGMKSRRSGFPHDLRSFPL